MISVGGRNRNADFQGERRSRDTHDSTTDPQARLYRKGKQQGLSPATTVTC